MNHTKTQTGLSWNILLGRKVCGNSLENQSVTKNMIPYGRNFHSFIQIFFIISRRGTLTLITHNRFLIFLHFVSICFDQHEHFVFQYHIIPRLLYWLKVCQGAVSHKHLLSAINESNLITVNNSHNFHSMDDVQDFGQAQLTTAVIFSTYVGNISVEHDLPHVSS